jgi:hypothetical protein
MSSKIFKAHEFLDKHEWTLPGKHKPGYKLLKCKACRAIKRVLWNYDGLNWWWHGSEAKDHSEPWINYTSGIKRGGGSLA